MRATTFPSNGTPRDQADAKAVDEDYGLTVHACLPPPVTGMSLCTDSVANAVAARANVRRYNWSIGSATITPRFRFVKLVRALLTPARLLLGSRPRHGVFYMPCNAGFAVLYNLLALTAARLRGYRCVLHHHYYRYIDRFEWRIKLLTWTLGPTGLQIVLCPQMLHRFRDLYGAKTLAVMPSTIQLLQATPPAWPPASSANSDSGPFCLGHISNLQLAKGLDLVLAVFRELVCKERDVRLILAGPIDTNVERKLIEDAQVEFGTRLEYRGAVYGPEKAKFFQDIQAKIFPTRLDAQPLVIMETFSYGRPVLSYGRGCIPDMMPRKEWSLSVDQDFVQPTVAQIERWLDDRAAYRDACQLARQQYEVALVDARSSLENFVGWVCGEAGDGFIDRGASAAT